MGRMGSVPILPVKQTVTIGTMLNFDGDGDGHRDGTSKQTLTCTVSVPITVRIGSEPNLSVKWSVTIGTTEFFLVNLILSDQALLCRLGL